MQLVHFFAIEYISALDAADAVDAVDAVEAVDAIEATDTMDTTSIQGHVQGPDSTSKFYLVFVMF